MREFIFSRIFQSFHCCFAANVPLKQDALMPPLGKQK
jgi:hypothetical protein